MENEMIKVYYRGSCGSSKHALAWFQDHDIKVQTNRISQINHRVLVNFLVLSDEGMKDIIKRPSRSSNNVKQNLKHVVEMNFDKAIFFLLNHTELLQTPLIMDETNFLAGYNEEEIRKFLPKKYRDYIRKYSKNHY